MRTIRSKEHGPLPKNRNEFDPEARVKETLGGHKVVILDSNKDFDKELIIRKILMQVIMMKQQLDLLTIPIVHLKVMMKI